VNTVPGDCIHNTNFLLNLQIGPKARALHYTKQKRFPSDKHSSLFCKLQKMRSCEYGPWGHIHDTNFLCNLQIGPKARVLHYTKIKRLPSDKHSSLFGTFINYEENEVF
jgi:hypothetical protein